MHIIIIDDGVNEIYFNLKPLKFDLEVYKGNGMMTRQNKNELVCTHGTVCAAIILKYAPNAEISSIKVLNSKNGRGKKEQLLTALQWCLENNIKLINLSIGTTCFKDFNQIRCIISELYRKGCIIVAAYNNRNIYTMPASLECTIGVKCNPELQTPSYQICKNKFEYFIEAFGKHELIDVYLKKYISEPFNSYATPYITATVNNIIEKKNCCSFTFIQKNLFKSQEILLCSVPDIIDSAVVVDLTKDEIIELFYFSVNNVYSKNTIKKMEEINKFINIVVLLEMDYFITSLIKVFKKIDKYIRSIFLCLNCDNIDLGKWGNLSDRVWQEKYYINKFSRLKVIEKKEKSIIYSFYKDLRKDIETRKSIDIPVIYIYGKRIPMIKLLLELENIFLEAGYEIKTVGEFQRAYLYGFDYIDCFRNRETVIYNVNSRYNPDIIICGIDSRIITHNKEDLFFDLEYEVKVSGRQRDFVYCPETIYGRIRSVFQ